MTTVGGKAIPIGTAKEALGVDAFKLFVDSVTDYAIFLLDAEGHVLTWNPGAERFKGYRPDEILGKHFSVFYPEEEARSGRPARQLALAAEQGRSEDEGWRVRKDGSKFWASVSITALRDTNGKVYAFGKVTRDLTAHRKQEEDALRLAEAEAARKAAELTSARTKLLSLRAMRLQSITAAFSEALSLEQVANAIGSHVIPALEADGGSLSIVSEDGQSLQLWWAAGDDQATLEPYRVSSLADQLPEADVARSQQPLFLESRELIDQAYPRLAPTNPALALAALPLIVGRRTVGVLGVSYRNARQFSVEERDFALSLARQCAQTVERSLIFERERRSREQAEAATQRLAFLLEASQLLSSSLDYEATLQSLAALAVPRLADWCGIDVADPDGSTRQLAVAHVDPDKVKYARELREKFPPAPETDGVRRVIRTGKSELYEEIPEALLVQGAQSAEHLRVIRELQLRSAMIVPLKTRQSTLGALSMVWAESDRRYTKADLALAEDLASRAALAMENAALYREAKAAIRKREEFLAVASHELRTPLFAIQLHVSMLLRALEKGAGDQTSWEMFRDKLQRSNAQVGRLAILLDQLLDVGRIAEGRLVLEPKQMDLSGLAKDVVSRFEDQAAKAGVALHVISSGPVEGRWDGNRLDQAMTNLLSNAIRYGRGRPVEIQVDRLGDQARVQVRDQGPGIDARDQKRIFERFERASSDKTLGGIGLGLWIVKELLDLHGGDVRVESEIGKGSTFFLELPLAAPMPGESNG